MKKIGIVTFYNAHNYGAMLQAVALQDFLSEKYDSYIINYRNPIIDKRYKLLKWENKNIKTIIKNTIKFIALNHKNNMRNKAFERFLKENFKLTKQYNSEEELKEDYPKFDCYITGSDQVWNHEITKGISDIYTLNFGASNIKKISYAASIGTTNFNKKNTIELTERLNRLDYISVRESSALEFLKNKVNKKVFEVIDPTLLVTKEYWDKKTKDCKKEKEKYILAYHLGVNLEYVKIVNFLSEYFGYKVIYFEKINKYYNNPLRSAFTCGPKEFVNLIKNAEFVISNSFHGTVISTIYHKQFLVVPHTETGSRMIDLMKKLKLENRIVKKFSDLKESQYKDMIDYTKTDKILEKEKNKSIEYLENALNDIK